MPAKKAKKPPAKKPSRLKEAAKQVATDADQVREDLNKLLLSLENLSVEALREVSDRALTLIAEKRGEAKRSLIGGVIGGALSIGESITGLFSRSGGDAPKKGRAKKAERKWKALKRSDAE
jgi:seryl-tRNA synthetase